ncbi:MAG: AMP-binding protein [Ignavibacteriaceae bacterium]|nr:AMP-binding protein [Ignavibacteriaceae bacterium]
MQPHVKQFNVHQISSIQDMLLQSNGRYKDKLAMEDLTSYPISKLSYKELLEHVLRFGNGLKKLGIEPRTHISLIGENRVQWGIAYLTALTFNHIIIPIDKNLSANEILNIIHESDSEVIIFSEAFAAMLKESKKALKNLKYFISMDMLGENEWVYSMPQLIKESLPAHISELPTINPEEPAEIIFTSGSLGRAKGVMLSQKNLASNLMSMTKMIEITKEDRFLSVLPIHHTYECTCGFLCPLYMGSSIHYARSLKTVAEDMQKAKPTIFLGVPLLYDKLFKRVMKNIQDDKIKSKVVPPLIKISSLAEKFGWKSLPKKLFKELHERFGGSVRLFIVGGAAPDPKVAKGLREFGFNFVQGYGLTETSPILALNQVNNFKDDAAGIPLSGIEIKINNPTPDGIGEIVAKGPSVMLGYYKNDALTKEAFENGWFKTGDLGYFDKDGFLHIAGRKKNVIIAKDGKNVFPEEIEDILHRSPFVLEVLVMGEKDSKHDEIITAQIVTDAEAFIEYSNVHNTPITKELIHEIISKEIALVNKDLPVYKQIRKFYIREKEFEKTTTQKIKRYLVNKDSMIEED